MCKNVSQLEQWNLKEPYCTEREDKRTGVNGFGGGFIWLSLPKECLKVITSLTSKYRLLNAENLSSCKLQVYNIKNNFHSLYSPLRPTNFISMLNSFFNDQDTINKVELGHPKSQSFDLIGVSIK